MSEEYTSGTYRMEMLKSSNWMLWKRRMLAVLRDLGLKKYIAIDASIPGEAKRGEPTEEENEAQEKWRNGDAKARTRIKLAISDAEMIHISGATTASEMWKQLSQVKESKGRLGILATRRALFRASAVEGFDMVDHISNLRKLQEELHIMENRVSDEDFVMILITSLPESWDYTSAYLGSSGNKPTLTSHKLIVILWKRIGGAKAELEILPAPRYMLQDIPKWEVTRANKTRTRILNVTIVTKKDTCHMIVGQKVADAKALDLRAEKDQIVEIGQIRRRRPTQT